VRAASFLATALRVVHSALLVIDLLLAALTTSRLQRHSQRRETASRKPSSLACIRRPLPCESTLLCRFAFTLPSAVASRPLR